MDWGFGERLALYFSRVKIAGFCRLLLLTSKGILERFLRLTFLYSKIPTFSLEFAKLGLEPLKSCMPIPYSSIEVTLVMERKHALKRGPYPC